MKHVGKSFALDGTSPQHVMLLTGALIDVSLLPGQEARSPGDQPTPAKLMIDTGATRTVIDKKILDGMGLTPIRFEPLIGVSMKPEQTPIYRVTIMIGMEDAASGTTAQVDFQADVFGSAELSRLGFSGLLGRDFLSNFTFKYFGPTGEFEIAVHDRSPGAAQAKRHAAQVSNEKQKHERDKKKAERNARRQNRR